MGARKLKQWLEMQGPTLPAASTVHNLLPGGPSPAPIVGRFEHDAPNPLWQMDFKGHFPYAEGRCHPLTLLDDHSRFSLCLAHRPDERRVTVQSPLIAVFERYGLPERMTMDNGSPWGDTTGSWTALELWLMRQGIRVGHSRPYHPQTQGKLERPHEALSMEVPASRYQPSSRQYNGNPVGAEYDEGVQVRKVGMIDLRNRSIMMGKGC